MSAAKPPTSAGFQVCHLERDLLPRSGLGHSQHLDKHLLEWDSILVREAARAIVRQLPRYDARAGMEMSESGWRR